MRSSLAETFSRRCPVNTFRRPTGQEDAPLAPGPSAGRSGAVLLRAGEWKLQWAEGIDLFAEEWAALVPPGNVFLEPAFLRVLETAPPPGVRSSYLLFCRGEQVLGAALLQYTTFRAAEAIRELRAGPAAGRFKRALARRLNLGVLVCGNLLLTGEHGFCFHPSLPANVVAAALTEGLAAVGNHLAAAGWPVHGALIKELPPQSRTLGEAAVARHFHPLHFQPNMVLELRPEWAAFDDYLAALVSKYRVRARRAFRLAGSLRRRELHLADLDSFRGVMHRLYSEVAAAADFNMLWLNENYLTALKRALPDRFRVFGYFSGEELVGFCSTIRNGEELEAHFLGFDAERNREHQLYLNMLFDIVRQGIAEGARRIVFARTAPEIKSSVGARAHDMTVLIRLSNPLFNRLTSRLVHYLEPTLEWTPRHPFGEGA